ncbi:MAG TPA: hypothetical protein VFN92_01760 [Solirubrobacterales bacterium]|nr:hypothetical protein [Solirubrobacterales bacterium]
MAVGCGGGSSTSSDTTEGEPQRLYPRVHGPSREFLIPGGDNLVQFFGHEATPAEREEASRVIHIWMRARVAKDWVKDCKYLSRFYKRVLLKDVRGVTNGKVTTCPGALEYFGENASGKLVNTLTGPIDSLRLRGLRGYAQYHGPNEIDWILPVRIEGGKFWVDIAGPIERTR